MEEMAALLLPDSFVPSGRRVWIDVSRVFVPFFDSIHCFWLNFYSVCLARFGGILMLLLLLLLVFTARRCASA